MTVPAGTQIAPPPGYDVPGSVDAAAPERKTESEWDSPLRLPLRGRERPPPEPSFWKAVPILEIG
ncbi:hypothetical protein GCM10010282_69020 [Streptomyces roseolus]|nr:hypothetical protein GCM10010282_69020 [Streptomyces roseolus]